ncbi:hypothetical protein G8A07_23765 [Roseateles sp. DAIF2]|uniref:hypothetical protein n=1 Tax=Roseateles sp. DAIF2 TaxID=2714952 RepID=UPI0018A28E80|nr:hypothetical protein [Roseateles sp. DAIF2]QPF75635.1 hypothetical protein G8A07_23765 [Roseateles sp. DAIF2]
MPDVLNPSGTVSVADLKKVADEAYEKHPGSCSHAVWHVIKRYAPEQPYRTANSLIAFMTGDKHWKEVPVSDLNERVNRGELIVGGLTDQPNGHVILVYPGTPKPSGGYAYTRKGKSLTMPARGMYPRAMSTSLGNWAGAKSKGDKTIWDAWASDEKFAQVKFWRYEPDTGK